MSECPICELGQDVDSEDLDLLCTDCLQEIEEASAMKSEWRYREP